MSGMGEMLMVGLAGLLRAFGPTVVLGAAGAVTGALVALALVAAAARFPAWLRRRSVRVASLAAHGASRAEIARRTGLSQDAVGLLLRVRSAHRGRRNLPLPARIAVPPTAGSRRRNRDWIPQVAVNKELVSTGEARSGAAHALPSAAAILNRLTRSGRAA